MSNMLRIFSEKLDTKFKDKYTEAIFTVSELNEVFLKPTIQLGVEEVKKLDPWLERFVKVD
jgi:hypothetical protein